MRGSKREGFTLVELLIVIVVIGILSAMMMLSSTEAVTSAKAAKIISNLRNIKTAALEYYTDNLDTFEANPKASIDFEVIKLYVNGDTNFTDQEGSYTVERGQRGHGEAKGNEWYAVYKFNDFTPSLIRITEKLEGRAKSVGLLADNFDWVYKSKSAPNDYERSVRMKIR